MKIPNTRGFQKIGFNHLLDINFKGVMKFHKKYTDKSHSFLVIDTALPSNNPSHFRKDFF